MDSRPTIFDGARIKTQAEREESHHNLRAFLFLTLVIVPLVVGLALALYGS